jgi:hypothetical protein
MEPEMSVKNTKNEILAAYEELMKKVQDKKTDEPKKIQEQQKQETIVKNTAALSHEGIVKEISGLKVSLSSSLDKLNENYLTEFRKFEELQQAIQYEKRQLEELYQLSASTDSLSAMLLAQKEKKEQFELEMAVRKAELEEKIKNEKERFDTEMAEKRGQWKKEQEMYAAQTKESLEEKKKVQTREDEEYQYNLKISRKKESDQYEEKKQKLEKELVDKKAAFEKDFAGRETKIKEAEAELNDLRIKCSSFPAELEKTVNEVTKALSEKLETNFRFEKELKQKETEGDLKLKEQIIETLRAKIKDIETTTKEFSQKAVTAEASVKDIAIRAIESSAKPYFIEKPKEGGGKE